MLKMSRIKIKIIIIYKKNRILHKKILKKNCLKFKLIQIMNTGKRNSNLIIQKMMILKSTLIQKPINLNKKILVINKILKKKKYKT